MKTKQQLINEAREANPEIIQTINDEEIALIGEDYENALEQWALMRLEQMNKEAELQAKAELKAAAEAKLAALGLTVDELKALGLG